jgi:hypothetical protein
MSDSETAVAVENPVLEMRHAHANRLKRMHGGGEALFKGRADTVSFTTVFLALCVGYLNLTFGIGRPEAATSVSAIVSGCLSLVSRSVTVLNSGLERPNEAERHNDYASHFGEVVHDISTECTLRHLHNNAMHASEAHLIRHMPTEMNRLEESVPNIPRAVENSNPSPKARAAPQFSAARNVGVLEVLGLDSCGPMSVPSLGGRRCILCAVHIRSRLMMHDAVRSKDEAPRGYGFI